MRHILCWTFVCSGLFASDSGLVSQGDPSAYAVQREGDGTIVAATLLTSDQVSQTFSNEIADSYLVIEVAVYPGGRSLDLRGTDFRLQVGSRTVRSQSPSKVQPWAEHGTISSKLPPVEATATVERTTFNPNVRKDSQTAPVTQTSASVRVTNPPDDQGSSTYDDDARAYDAIQRFALPEGIFDQAVAGYIFFPLKEKRSKKDAIELQYRPDAKTLIALPFPKK